LIQILDLYNLLRYFPGILLRRTVHMSDTEGIGSDEFRRAMRQLAGAVSIITTRDAESAFGMTATAVCSVSAEPPTVLVCVNRRTATHAAIARAGVFCVNVLAGADQELSNRFSGAQTGAARFTPGDWRTLATGAPVLADAPLALDCRVSGSVDHGTHTLYFGLIAACAVNPGRKPLVYADGRYATLARLDGADEHPPPVDYWSM
jgi:flavin reductase (DIM6/NTAB) family NADH-FMN oxidoreductase RutF